MSRLLLFVCFFSLTYGFVYALGYVESSQGLENPQLESGRTELEMVDINADGNIDILSIGDHGSPYINTQEHGVMVWFGNGQGVWNVYQNGSFGYGGIAIGDINNDGFMDIGYGMHHNYSGTDFGDSIIEAALGDGTGQNWTPWDDGISIGDPNPWGMFCTDFADINNDGFLDLGGNSFGGDDGVHIFINHGDGTWHQCFGFLGGMSRMDFLFGDVNGDGFADFAAGHQYGSIYLGDGNGNFNLVDGNLPWGGSNGRRGPSLGDIDNDGNQEFAFINANGGIEVWKWQGNNTWQDFSGNLPDSGPYESTQLYDMNIDGFMDVSAFGNSTVTVWLGNGTGNWTHATTFYTPSPGYRSAFRVGGDADHNGYPDIALVAKEANGINHLRFFKETSVSESLFVFPIYPRAGEKFYKGSVHFIHWSCSAPQGGIATIKLELSTSGPSGPWSLIVSGYFNNGRFQWQIPTTCVGSDNCYIRYTATTATDTAVAITPASFTILPIVAVSEHNNVSTEIPGLKIFPTPTRDRIWISIKTAKNEDTKIRIFDNTGKLVKDLFKIKGGGKLKIYWDRKDNNGKEVPLGIYFISLQSRRTKLQKKIILIK
ncbi:hypothetical protein ES705_32032 [subsurface metagenome]